MSLPYFRTQAESGAQTPYLVHLLLDTAVPVGREALLEGWRQRLGRVEPVDEGQADALHVALPDYLSTGGVPLQLAVMALDGIGVQELAACLRQSWTWSDAAPVSAACRASLTLSDFNAAGVDRRIRLALFHGAVAAMLQTLPVRAIQWLPSQQVLEPRAYLERLAAGEGLRGSALNVRRFRMQAEDGERVQVLDTIGLGAFGLPDLQVRFRDVDTDRAVDWLYGQAARLFDEGERFVFAQGVPAAEGSGTWRFHPEDSAAEPKRRVLEVTTGAVQ